MKEKNRTICFVLISSLLLILTGCGSHGEEEENLLKSSLRIRLDWTDVSGELPDGMRVVFYPKDSKGRKTDAYLSPQGGEVEVVPGIYSVVIYNYNTESVLIRGEETYGTIEAYTGHCTGLNITGTEEMVWEPDPLFVANADPLEVVQSDVATEISFRPKAVVKTYSFDAEVKGLQYVANVIGYVDGMADCYHLGTGAKRSSGSSVYFELTRTGDWVNGRFSTFGTPSETARADGLLKLTLAFVKVDHSVQKLEIDITQAVKQADETPPGGEGEEPGKPPKIELPVEEGGITVEKPDKPPPGQEEGSIGGNVGGWGEEDEVPL